MLCAIAASKKKSDRIDAGKIAASTEIRDRRRILGYRICSDLRSLDQGILVVFAQPLKRGVCIFRFSILCEHGLPHTRIHSVVAERMLVGNAQRWRVRKLLFPRKKAAEPAG